MRWSPEMCANLIRALIVQFCHTGQFSYCWGKFSRSSDFLQLLQGKINCIDFFKVCIYCWEKHLFHGHIDEFFCKEKCCCSSLD